MQYINYNGRSYSYEYFNHENAKLVIIFQSMGQSNLLATAVRNGEHLKAGWKEKVYDVSSKYNFLKIFKEEKFDLLILPDTYSEFISWYLVDYGEDMSNDFAFVIEHLITELGYKNKDVTLFGQSKGGFASMLYGNKIPSVNNVIVSMPIFDPKYRVNKKNSPIQKIMNERMCGSKLNVEQLLDLFQEKIDKFKIDKSKRYFFNLGISDENTREILEFIKENKTENTNIQINKEVHSHAKYAKRCEKSIRNIAKEIANDE